MTCIYLNQTEGKPEITTIPAVKAVAPECKCYAKKRSDCPLRREDGWSMGIWCWK